MSSSFTIKTISDPREGHTGQDIKVNLPIKKTDYQSLMRTLENDYRRESRAVRVLKVLGLSVLILGSMFGYLALSELNTEVQAVNPGQIAGGVIEYR